MLLLSTSLLSAALLASASPTLIKRADPQGIDVSHFQGSVDWSTVAANGVSFTYIKATEGTTFEDPEFSANYDGAADAGLIRGAYHFAHPDESSGATQANYFLKHGGGWSSDGITLPGTLDIEANPSGAECYGLSASAMVSWIKDFSNTYESATGVWWTSCTGNSATFGSNPLWVARYASSIGTLPASWSFTTFWQYADSGSNPGDQDMFNGSLSGLKKIALG
ncbi:N,O-diacetylmuramidase [Artomyces pyxidatus]|uniref:N,O-diacetylmuramidase n=1 Tax=Artomyces pyxidatus TaxID=48021 RepID=A0ACB8SP85_9AGAM|nr:N,O-diacetylmuramidase [Artomyces pyxidatus]